MGTSLEQQAATCLTQGNYAAAIALYSQAIEACSTTRANYWYLGLAQLLSGDPWEAQAVWLSVLTNATPAEIAAWTVELQQILTSAAQTCVAQAQFQRATQIYQHCLELDDQQADIHVQLGQVFALQGNVEEAIACWQQAIEHDPSSITAHLQLAETFHKIERFEEATAHYLAALQLDSTQPHLFYTLPGHRFYFFDRGAGGSPLAGGTAPTPPLNQSLWTDGVYSLGLCLLRQGRLDDAILYLRQATQADENFAPAYGDLGMAWLRQGNWHQALSCWHRATRLSPQLTYAYQQWTTDLKQRSRLDANTALAVCLLETLAQSPQTWETYACLGKLFAQQMTLEHSTDLAIAAYQQALVRQPEPAEVHLELGKQLLKSGRVDMAIAHYQTALALHPNQADLHLELGKAFAQQGQLDTAIAHYQTASDQKPDLADLYFHWGDALSLNGNWQAAIHAYQTKVKLQPDAFDAYYRLGMLWMEQGNLAEAIAHFRQAMHWMPSLAQSVSDVLAKPKFQSLFVDSHEADALPIDCPNGFYESTEDWAIAAQLEKTHYFPIYPPAVVPLQLPQTLEPTVDLRFCFGETLKLPSSFVAIVPHGRSWIDEWHRTAVITPDQKILGDVSPDFPILSPGHPDKHPSQHSLFTVQKLPPPQSISGTVAILSSLFNDAYFHWMFDVLPRWELIRASEIPMAEIDYWLVNHRLPFQQESLARLGLSTSPLLDPKDYPHITAERLIVPSFAGAISWMPSWTCDFLRHLFLDEATVATTEKIERLYVTRNHTSNRRVINEAEVVDLLEKFGFQSVALESLSIVEQAALIHHAKVIVAPHGGGLTNIVFCQPGTQIIELFSPNYVYPCYWFISNLINLEHYYVLGDIPLGFHLNKLLHPNARTEDILVNIDRLANTLRLAHVI